MLFPEIADFIYIRSRINRNDMKNDGDVLCLSQNNLTGKNELHLRDCFCVHSADVEERYLLQRDDIIMVTGGPLEKIGNFFRYNLPMKAAVRGEIFLSVIRPLIPAEEVVLILDRNYYNIKNIASPIGERPDPMMHRVRRRDLENLEI